MQTEGLEDIFAKLQQLVQQEYERGGRDALERVVDELKRPKKASLKSSKRSGKRRAPRGTARSLIKRVLSEQKAGAAVPTIMAAAETAAEKIVSVAAIRFELYRGKKERLYRNSKGKWTLPGRRSLKAEAVDGG